ncbi:MAG: hypothetical protein WDN06_09515 [Asticcacaulis sp.]
MAERAPVRLQDRQSFYAQRTAKAISAMAGFAFRHGYDTVLFARRFILSLYGQLLILSLVFVIIVEAVLLVSSLAQDQERWLLDRVHQAELVSQAVDTAHESSVSTRVSSQLLKSANVEFLAIWSNGVRATRLWGGVVVPDKVIDLDVMHKNFFHDLAYLWAPWKTMMSPPTKLLHIQAQPKVRAGDLIEIVVKAAPLRTYLKSSVISSLRVSLSISLAAGLLVFASLSAFIVHPIRQLTRAIVRFKSNPEVPGRDAGAFRPSRRNRPDRPGTGVDAGRGARRFAFPGAAGGIGPGGQQDQPRPAQHADLGADGVGPAVGGGVA